MDAPADRDLAARAAAFQKVTGKSPDAFVEAWEAREIPDTPENADLAMDALALRAALQRQSLAA